MTTIAFLPNELNTAERTRNAISATSVFFKFPDGYFVTAGRKGIRREAKVTLLQAY
jgi:hypothetical protein